jgi:hypothetical protein
MEEQKVFMLIEIAPKKSKASRRAAETHFANTLQFMNPIFGERPPSHSEGIKQPTIKETAGKMLRSGLVLEHVTAASIFSTIALRCGIPGNV